MLTRLTHAAMAFAVTAALYQGYVLAVVPFVEPEFAHDPIAATEQDFAAGRAAPDKYRDLLAAYFPPDHWCFKAPPITFENGQAMVVLDKYEQKQNGETRVPHCAIVFFPRPLVRGAAPPRDAIVLEPSGGAVLQMEKVEASAAMTTVARSKGFGRMQFGQLLGDISVRSDMREPGPEDDLAIATRDLYMNEDGIRTTRPDEAVTMQLGQHFGRGRGLEIRFLQAEPSRGEAPSALYGKLDSLKILQEVSAEISPGSLRIFQSLGDDDAPGGRAASTAPIRIQSNGPFRIEFNHYVATFTDKVRLRQIHADGKLDQLLAEELRLNFTKNSTWNAGPVTPVGAATQQASFSLEPESIIATGPPEAPISLSAPSQDAAATAQRLFIELANRRITFDTGDDVMLRYRGAEIHAPLVKYELPPKGSSSRLGNVWASGGGRLDAVVDPQRPNERLEVRWTDSMRIVRRQDAAGVDQPVLVLDGRPRITLSSMGTMWADRLEVFLREGPAPGASQPTTSGAIPANVQPEQITASGRVAIKSNELTADVNQLDIKIDHSAATVGGATVGASSPLALLPQAGGARQGYEIKGVVLKVTAAMRDRRPVVTSVAVDGAVEFKEIPATNDPAGGLKIVAERLSVLGADTPDKEITIHGGGGANGLPAHEAQISARGANLRAPALTLRTGSSQAAIDSPGAVELLVDRDLSGQPLPQPELVEIKWRDAMRLNGNRLSFAGDVRVQQAGGGWLRTEQLVVQLTRPVQFDAGGSQEKPQVAQLECWGGATAEFDQRDATGVTSRQRITVQTLSANQLTGLISGDGPGFVDSIHLSRGAGALLAIPGAAAAPVAADTGQPSLRHLHIDFVRGVGGNLHVPRTVNVHGDVRAVYGPVQNWDDRLAMTPGGRPGPETVWIACDQLGVTESPAGRLQNPPVRLVELEAQGRVQIEGQDPKGAAFSATGNLAKYDQSKGMFILEGKPATIDFQQVPGGPRSPQPAEKMTYWQETGRVQVHGAHGGQINVIDPNSKK